MQGARYSAFRERRAAGPRQASYQRETTATPPHVRRAFGSGGPPVCSLPRHRLSSAERSRVIIRRGGRRVHRRRRAAGRRRGPYADGRVRILPLPLVQQGLERRVVGPNGLRLPVPVPPPLAAPRLVVREAGFRGRVRSICLGMTGSSTSYPSCVRPAKPIQPGNSVGQGLRGPASLVVRVSGPQALRSRQLAGEFRRVMDEDGEMLGAYPQPRALVRKRNERSFVFTSAAGQALRSVHGSFDPDATRRQSMGGFGIDKHASRGGEGQARGFSSEGRRSPGCGSARNRWPATPERPVRPSGFP